MFTWRKVMAAIDVNKRVIEIRAEGGTSALFAERKATQDTNNRHDQKK
jgi:hypothetical protein